MSERKETVSDHPESDVWQVLPAALVLKAHVDPIEDLAFGRGWQLLVGDLQTPTIVELYPEALFARIQAPDLRLELFRLRPPQLNYDDVLLTAQRSHQWLSTRISTAGEVAFIWEPGKKNPFAGASSTTPAIEEGGPAAPHSEQLEKELPTTVPPGAKKQRVTLTGRVGAAPSIRETRQGKIVGRFPLAVREANGKTIWHAVYAFGGRARKLEGLLTKGELIEVIAYPHIREVPGRDGSTRHVQEFYAAVIKAERSNQTQH